MATESLAGLASNGGACLKKDSAGKSAPKREEDYIGLIKRTRPMIEVTKGDVTLVEFANIDCEGAPIVDAFPSTGVVAVLAGMQLVKSMGLPLVGVLKSPGIPSVAAVHCEQPSHPARIYGNRGIVIFICEISIEEATSQSVAELIYDFAKRHRCPMVFTIEGMATGDTIKLESGEEVSLSREDEEGEAEEGLHTLIDDSKLAEAHMKKEEEAAAKQQKAEAEHQDHLQKEPAGEKEQQKKANKNGNSDKQEQKREDEKKAVGASQKDAEEKKQKKPKKKKSKGDDHDEEGKASADKKESKEAVARRLYGDKVHFITTDPVLAEKLRRLDCVPVVDGVISGVTGAILAEAALMDQEVTGLVVPTSTIIPSAKSAIVLLHLLEKLVPGIAISVSELEKLEDELEDVRKAVMKALPALTSKTAPPSNLYL